MEPPQAKYYFVGQRTKLSRSRYLLSGLCSLCNISSHMLLITILLISLNISQISALSTVSTVTEITKLGSESNEVTTVSEMTYNTPCYNDSLDMIMMSSVSCRNNGTCYLNNNDNPTCRCINEYFTGADCSILDLQKIPNDVFETGITFMWPIPIYLANNYGLFTRTPLTSDSEISLYTIPEGTSKTVTVTGLEPDAKEYILCIIHGDYLGIDNSTSTLNTSYIIEQNLMKSEYLNCGIVQTPFDVFGPYTIAAWSIGIVIGVSMLMTILCRACCNCRDRTKRENMIAEVMGNFDFLRKSSSKKRDKIVEDNGIKDKV